ncbi:MAG: isoleucine--tRNA ligase, partial [Candidatus Hodarchaeales archaeon]
MVNNSPWFKPIDSKYDWIGVESEIRHFWERKDIFKKLQSKLEGSKQNFSFIDGPITANNPMGVHTARGRTLKDIFQRYYALKGFKQRFQNGFDTQGLWVEVEVEKSLGLNSKQEILTMGLESFVEACKDRVRKYSMIITEQSKKLGQQMDWEHSYYTHHDNNIKHIWYFLKKCHEKKWLYRSKLVMPWCPRCSTSLSTHEMTDSYRTVRHPSVYLQLPIKNQANRYFMVWTTTPWTLTANVALAVHPELDYVLVTKGDKEFVLAEKVVDTLLENYRLKKRIKGENLVGLEYRAPFEELSLQKGIVHRVVPWKLVSAEEGTGIVHIAPGCGAEDFQLGKELDLDVVSPIDEQGLLMVEPFFGLRTDEASEPIFDDLKNKNMIFRIETIEHRYPVCWRCKTELVFKLESEWFISCNEIRDRLKEANKSVTWVPSYAGKRMDDWLTNMSDWCISRKRYWGLPLPFYACTCGELIVIGSRKELRELAERPELVDELQELHKPWIDDIKIICPSCGNSVSRVSEVGDCWLDAGIVPFSTLKYLENKDYWKQWFPADLVCEMIEQVRLWFYSQLFMSVTLENKAPFKKVVVYESVRNEDGSEMHKSAVDSLGFDETHEKIGADLMRWFYAGQKTDSIVRYSLRAVTEVRKTFTPLWNAVRFFINLAALDVVDKNQLKHRSTNVFDLWIQSRLKEVTEKYNISLEAKDIRTPTVLLEDFISDLTNYYIRISRRRFWKTKDDQGDKNAAYSTLYTVLLNLT